jgi:superfamily II DNA or RNA helicase
MHRLDAAYLHARMPDEARVVFYGVDGPDEAAKLLPAEVHERLEPVAFEMLVATEESTLRPVTPLVLRAGAEGGAEEEQSGTSATAGSEDRMVPALWHMAGRALRLEDAIPLLTSMQADYDQPGLGFLCRAARLVQAMLERGDYAPAAVAAAPESSESGERRKSLLAFVPYWRDESVRVLGGLAELVPTMMRTARFLAHDEPVWAVSARNVAYSFVGHALDACARAAQRTERYHPRHETAERLPRTFWRTRPEPVLEILAPEKELEEGVPWGIQLGFRPVPGLPVHYPLEDLEAHRARALFKDSLAFEGLASVREMLEEVTQKIPALRRAMNMSDGRASLNRQELDQVLDHLTLLQNEGFDVTLPGLEMHRLSARVQLKEVNPGSNEPRPWFEFRWSLAVDDKELDPKEFEQLVNARSPLVTLDRGAVLLTPRDRAALEEFRKRAADGGEQVSFFEAMRLKLGGASHLHGLALETLEVGPRLDEIVDGLEHARSVEPRALPPGFLGELRPYQERGHAWSYFLVDQGFGACLADDMGLGKTVQAIAVVLDWRLQRKDPGPVLLVCPVSVLGNWRRELQRFAPELRTLLHHGKQRSRKPEDFAAEIGQADVVLTSYNLLQRDSELLLSHEWEGVILDEAQNIKNPTTRQSRAAREVQGKFRMALTGTPLENRPLDLWSIMDFLNPGLLGTRSTFMQTLEHPIVRQNSRSKASMLARLVRPFVLRRLKTDPEIITDLPEKSEQVVVATLSREQAVLYESVVRKGLAEVEKAGEGIQRRGAILTTLLRLKQVCNHPAHFLSDGSSLPARSGKLDLLSEMLTEALEEGDRCLVFTQFKEMGTLLKTHLEATFGGTTLFLHGGIPQKDREDMVARFQESAPDGPKIFVLSLKAGGTGLNLTAANRVFHFDRWWNPAVEDQATDRAFRIGQRRNVFVHKFVCNGTLEERIQTMLERKRDVANTLLGAGESWLTELSNDELRRLLILDRKEALA